MIEDGAGDGGGLGRGFEGGGTGDGALSIRRRRLMRRVGRDVIEMGTGECACAGGVRERGSLGGGTGGVSGLGDAGIVGKLIGLPLLVLRR